MVSFNIEDKDIEVFFKGQEEFTRCVYRLAKIYRDMKWIWCTRKRGAIMRGLEACYSIQTLSNMLTSGRKDSSALSIIWKSAKDFDTKLFLKCIISPTVDIQEENKLLIKSYKKEAIELCETYKKIEKMYNL